MKHTMRHLLTDITLVFVACVILLAGAVILSAQQPPQPAAIALLADGAPLGPTVTPPSSGLVTFTARITAGSALLRRASLSVNTSGAATFFSPTPGPVSLSVYWGTAHQPNGAQAVLNASATDTAGNTTTKAAVVTLVK